MITVTKKFLILIGLLLAVPASHAAVQGKEVTYSAGGTTLKGYIAYDDALQGARPGILVVHEWWGHNEYARKRARMFAEQGYTALALDMYGDGKQAHHPDEAGKFATEVNQNSVMTQARFDAALLHFPCKGGCIHPPVFRQHQAKHPIDGSCPGFFHGKL